MAHTAITDHADEVAMQPTPTMLLRTVALVSVPLIPLPGLRRSL
jgi:hypothetical protein